MSAKITAVESYILKIPVKIRLSIGDVGETSHLITKVHTDCGVVGIGEGTPYAFRGKSYTDIYNAYLLCAKIAKKLKGKQLQEAKDVLPQIQANFMEKSFFDYGPFLSIDTAVIDALSKLDNVPFGVTLGGVYRNKVPVCGTVFLDTPQNMAVTAQKWISKGVRHLKVKVIGRNEVDSVNLKHIRDAVGYDPLIRIDVNGAYKTADCAIDNINGLSIYEVAIVEQPIRWNDLDGLKKLRRAVSPKIMVDESLRCPSDVELISTKGAADIINFHPSKLGCLSITKKAIKNTVDFGLEFMIGSAVMTGIGVATHLHLAASIKELHHPCEETGLNEMFNTDILDETLDVVDGCIELPNGFGLAVKIDKGKLKKYFIDECCAEMFFRHMVYRTYNRISIMKRKIRK